MRLFRYLVLLVLAAAASSVAVAGEADDLQRMIDGARQGASDLERLDEQKSATEELTLLRTWLDTAWRQRSEDKFQEVRVTLDRVQAQADMVRQRIATAKFTAQAVAKEAEVQAVRAQIAKTREALQAATIKKATLEAKSK